MTCSGVVMTCLRRCVFAKLLDIFNIKATEKLKSRYGTSVFSESTVTCPCFLPLQDSVREIEKLVQFLGLDVSDDLCRAVAEKCDFKHMKNDKKGLEDEFWATAWRGEPNYYRKGMFSNSSTVLCYWGSCSYVGYFDWRLCHVIVLFVCLFVLFFVLVFFLFVFFLFVFCSVFFFFFFFVLFCFFCLFFFVLFF